MYNFLQIIRKAKIRNPDNTYSFRGDVQKKVVHLADRPPPPKPGLKGAFSPKVPLFLSPGTNLKSSKSFFCFVSRTFHYCIQFSSGNDYKPLSIWLKTEFSKLFEFFSSAVLKVRESIKT